MRALTSLTTTLTLVLALAACGDDKETTSQTTQTPATDPTATATDPSAGSTTNDGTTTDAPTTMNPTTTMPTTTGDDESAGTTTNATVTTTTEGTTATTTDATTATTTDASGTTTDGTTTNGDTTGGGGGEDLYGPCAMANPPCPADQQCIEIMGIEGSFCAPACEGMGCPDVPAGVKAQAMCVLTEPMMDEPTLCALICNPAMKDECPAGETCKPVPMQMGVGLCTAP